MHVEKSDLEGDSFNWCIAFGVSLIIHQILHRLNPFSC